MASPQFSIVTAVYNPPRGAFEDTVRSVLDQRGTDWEWILTDDCSPEDWVRPRLRELAASDARIRVVERHENGGIVAASNDSLRQARGEFVALLDHDDVLAPDALSAMAEAIEENPEADYLYSDQDQMTADGRLYAPYYKPDWSPERFRHHMYTTHFSVLRRSLVLDVGGFRTGFDGSQDHDLVLRVTERSRSVVHVPKVLYHWRAVEGSASADPTAKPYAWDAGVRAVQDHLDRVGINARAEKGRFPGQYRIIREPDLTTPVSVIIPTIGTRGVVFGRRRDFVVETIKSVLEKSEHTDLEFIVVFDDPTPADVLEQLRALDADVKLVPFHENFNFSAKCNSGAVMARGEVLLFLNDDVEVRSDGFVESLIAPLHEEGVGLTGAKLLFEDMTIQHAGVVYGSGTINHPYYKVSDAASPGAYGDLWMNREATALTGACIAVRREVFEQVGGFTEALPGNYNDVDFSLKVGYLGLRRLWLHDVVLFHFESVSREPKVQPFERQHLITRWDHFRRVRERYSNNVR